MTVTMPLLQRRPAPRASTAPSPHSLVDQAVKDLGLRCIGVDGHTLVFARENQHLAPSHDVVKQLIARLNSNDAIQRAMRGRIDSIRIQ